MIVMGLGGSGHDFSTCIYKNNQLISFIEDERVLRKKHSMFDGMGHALMKMPAMNYCLKQADLTIEEMDYLVANSSLESYYYSRCNRRKEIVFINHHFAHACSAFYPSPFQEAAILVIDGAGNSETRGMTESISLWIGKGKQIEKIVSHGGKSVSRKLFHNEVDVAENSIGVFYHIATYLVGFGPFDEGKTMGLAPYGTSKYYAKLRELVDFTEEGKFSCPLESLIKLLSFREEMDLSGFDTRADLAWAAQAIAEEAVIHSAAYLKKISGLDKICIAGGVALNSVANYKLYKTNMFRDFFIQPAAGDNGTSIGAAYYGAHVLGGINRQTQ